MTLTLSHGPLSGAPSPGNYQLQSPAHSLFFDDFPRRIRAVLGGETVLDSRRGKLLHETGMLPQLYVRQDDVRQDLLRPTDHSTHCPFKGDARYWTLQVGDRAADNAVWAYPEPLDAAAWLRGYVAVYWKAMDSWLDEEETVQGLCDPYHRVDVRRASQHVRVLAGDEVVAETDRAALLSETGLPNRYYLPREDVRTGLLQRSETVTGCPYKGTATYWSLNLPDRELSDAAFSYEDPLDSTLRARGHLCFLHDELAVETGEEPH